MQMARRTLPYSHSTILGLLTVIGDKKESYSPFLEASFSTIMTYLEKEKSLLVEYNRHVLWSQISVFIFWFHDPLDV